MTLDKSYYGNKFEAKRSKERKCNNRFSRTSSSKVDQFTSNL